MTIVLNDERIVATINFRLAVCFWVGAFCGAWAGVFMTLAVVS